MMMCRVLQVSRAGFYRWKQRPPCARQTRRETMKEQVADSWSNTYIWIEKQWMYLATVMDLYSRAIVGWALDSQMTDQLVISAVKMAFDRRGCHPGLIIHTDRGVQYRSQKYIDFICRHGAKPSMSRKGNCWDNAPMESSFSRLKVELIYAEKFETVGQMKSAVFEYIEVFYNRLRRHSALGYQSPAEYEKNAAKAA